MKNVILVVDDDKTNLSLAQRILGPQYRIAAAGSGEAALKYLEMHRPDLILLDINMPEMDGFEVMEKLRSNIHTESIPVIFLTADSLAETEIKCFQMGAMDFVTKPFVPDILLSRVSKTIELDQYRHKLETMVNIQAQKIMEDSMRFGRIQDSVIIGMANLIESRDGSTGKHVKNTQTYVGMIANELLAISIRGVPFNRHEGELQVVDEFLQHRIFSNHSLQHCLVGFDLQEIVCNVKSCCSLVISGNFFKVVEDTCLDAEVAELCKFLPPLVGRAYIGIQNYLTASENMECISIEASVFTTCCQPYIFRQIICSHKCSLFALDNGDRLASVHRQQMFTEETLTQIEVRQSEQRMNPCYMVEWLLHALACLGIVKHHLSGANTTVDIGLPEHA